MPIKTPLPFENLLADLQRHGFAIGLDHHLRLQAMLAALDGRCMPSDLKSLLCPIFAASEQQQRLFYSLFDHHFSIFALAAPAPPALDPVDIARAERKTDSQRTGNLTRRVVLLLLVAVIGGALFFWLRHAPSAQPQLPPAETPANPQPLATSPAPGPTPQPLATSPAPGPTAVPSQKPAASFPTTLIVAILIVVIPAAWFLLGEVARWHRRRLVLQRQEGRLPPHSWPMRLQGTGVSLYSSPAFYTAARWLHTRQTGEGMDLDVGGTIDATIRSGGFAAFHYYRRTRLPDYLVLIDRASFRDHQARLFDSLAAALHEEGLFLERFFYEGDPRECWTQGSDSPLSLIELQRRYPEHRLLLFGDGAALLDPVSGQLAAWTEVFSGWREKAVLSPVATTEWGVRERRLAGQSLVLPATQEGLQALGDYFRSAQSADGSWPGGAGRPAVLDTPADLREHLGADVFAWLCACAVYPELHWDLTLHIACLASLPPGLVTEENLLKLVRLPWFRSGFIPDDLRNQLIHELAPGQEREVRSAVIEMLAKTPAPEGTIAADRQQMEIVLQRYFLSRQEGASVRRLRRILEEVPQNLRRHYVALRSTELAVPSPLDFLLPRALRKILFVEGHPLLGMRGITRLAATLGVSAVSVKTSTLKRALLASAAGLGLVLSVAFIVSFSQNSDLAAGARDAAAKVKLDTATAPPIPSLDDLTKLDALRQSADTISRYNREGPPLSYRWGLYVGYELYPTVRRLYFQRFRQLLFGSTQSSLVVNLRTLPARPGPTDSYQYPYDSLKSYLITTSNHDKSTKLYLSPVLYSRWEEGKKVDAARAQLVRKQFDFYSEELKFENPFPSENDSATIDRARKYLAQFAGAERIYRSMLAETNAKAPPLNFNQKFPGSVQTVVNNRDVAGAYSKAGWPIMQDAIKHADRYVSGEQWVLGDQSANFGDPAKLQDDLHMLYFSDFIQQWQDYLKRSVVQTYSDIPDAAKKLATTASSTSPLLEMFCMASQSVGVDPDIAKSFKAVLTVVPASCGDQYVGGANQDYMKALSTLQASLGQITSPDPNDPNVAAAANNAQLATVAANQMAQGFGADALASTVQKLIVDPIENVEPKLKGLGAADLDKGGRSLCTEFKALMTKYPFNPQTTNEAGLTDINMIFKPGEGSLWKFYDQKLQKLLPKQGSQYVAVQGGAVTLQTGFVGFFNRLAQFSTALYAGGPDPHFTYSLQPARSDGIQSVTLNIDGQSVTSTNGGGAAKQFTWPGTQAGVQGTYKFGGGADNVTWATYQGLWGAFKFFAKADTPAGPSSPSHLEWVIRTGDQISMVNGKPLTVRFDLDMGASPTIFQKGYFSNWSCVENVAK